MFRSQTSHRFNVLLVLLPFLLTALTSLANAQPTQPLRSNENQHPNVAGIYPHLAMWNEHGECGVGALLPWAGKLWAITYAPHQPLGSTDKLYQIDSEFNIEAFSGSVGGTPANRMIHRESQQAILGPYFINQNGDIRVIQPEDMPGRLTGVARHLTDPENKVYFATMEEGIYEVDVHSLQVKTLFQDHQGQIQGDDQANGRLAKLPGYHGKGLYSGQGRLVYANNGESSVEARQRPDIPSGCLAQWDGESEQWEVVRRNQFTDICGPGGLQGNPDPNNDPLWAIGWDHRSLLLMLLDHGQWYTYRLPKASHCYDGAHGWNTEWPRFRQLDQERFLLNMHGMFWDFPATFSRTNSAGIRPQATYLKVIGDYCLWQDQMVFGCDDTAANEFLNTRKLKGEIAGPGQSHSNLWFTPPEIFDQLGTPQAKGAVWLHDPVDAQQVSDPFLFSGFEYRQLCLANHSEQAIVIDLEVDVRGTDQWESIQSLRLEAGETLWHSFPGDQKAQWLRLRAINRCASLSAHFSYRNPNRQPDKPDARFDGLATLDSPETNRGRVRVRGEQLKTLAYVAQPSTGTRSQDSLQYYELDGELKLSAKEDPASLKWQWEHLKIPGDVLQSDAASMIFVDQNLQRWRFPFGSEQWRTRRFPGRLSREVVTERDLFHCAGIFYELPARNAGGIARVRPICRQPYAISDFCSYRGLMVLVGTQPASTGTRLVVANDRKSSLWLGVIDDLWQMGKPTGKGGPWFETSLAAGELSDPYLLNGFEQRELMITHDQPTSMKFLLELDVFGTGEFLPYRELEVAAKDAQPYKFPEWVDAYWVRIRSRDPGTVSAQFHYR